MIKLKDLLKEQPTQPDEKKPPQSSTGGGEETSKELKIDIPDSPFNPDASQITAKLVDILKTWQEKEYPSDDIRWKEYHKDISKLVKYIKGEEDEV